MKGFSRLALSSLAVLALSLVFAAANSAAAQTTVIYAVTSTNNLISFTTAAPGTAVLNVPITGLQTGENIVDIDFRPATGQLYGLGVDGAGTGRLYTISLATGTAGAATLAATLSADPTDASSPYTTVNGTIQGIDFNPVPDRLRIVTDTDQNLRVNPANGFVTTDGTLAFAAGDPNAAQNPSAVAVAYTNSFAGSTTTTLYNIDINLDVLTTQNPPNNGTLNTTGPLTNGNANSAAFDIRTAPDRTTNTAYGVFSSSLYTVDLTSGTATLVGATPAAVTIRGIAVPQAAAGVVISEFRFRGTGGASDEFVEIANTTNVSITVVSSDTSAGWSIGGLQAAGNGSNLVSIIPNGTVIPPRGHYLAANSAYSLAAYTARDNAADFSTAISDNSGVGLFTTATTANYSATNRLDSVAFTGTGTARPLYVETTGLAPIAITAGASDQFSFVRKLTTGLPQDNNDNVNDFVLVSPTGTVGTATPTTAVLGAAGPEGLTSPIQRNAEIKALLIDPAQASTASPNRSRDTTVYLDALTPSSPTGVTAGVPNSPYNGGTLSIQRRFTNNTTQTISRLRFRVVDITTLNSPGYTAGGAQADVRFLTSNGTLRAPAPLPVGVTLLGITIDQPPTQQLGAALNSSGTVTLTGGTLAPGATVDVQFLLGVVQGGTFRYLVNVEALPAPPGLAAPQPTTTKGVRTTKQ